MLNLHSTDKRWRRWRNEVEIFAWVRIYFLNNWIMIKVESRVERSFRPKVDSPGGASPWVRSILSCSQPKIKFKEKRAKTVIAKPCVSECFNIFFFLQIPAYFFCSLSWQVGTNFFPEFSALSPFVTNKRCTAALHSSKLYSARLNRVLASLGWYDEWGSVIFQQGQIGG